VVRGDWLVGGDRRVAAAERIYAAATDLITRDGLDAFDIDKLAARVHCSRATIYRHVGGKAEIRDGVLFRAAAQIIEAVRLAVDGLSGPPMLRSIRAQEMSWLTGSPIVAGFATDLNGLTEDDPQAAQWIVRVVMAMLYWPVEDARVEREMVQRFVAPAFGPSTVGSDRT
jgi:AcrR family transcriptional regulator